MKTLNIIKTGILSLIILAASFTISAAQKSINNIVDRKLARVSASIPTFTESKPAIVIYNAVNPVSFDVVVEASVEIENWMINTDTWAKVETEHHPKGITMEVVEEEDITLEAWMFNFDIFNKEDIVEPELALEDWMLSPDSWK